jgi:hypothetical protein
MSRPREIVDFSETLPDEQITQILGATLSCLTKSKTYDEFKTCLVVPPKEEGSLMDTISGVVGNIAQGVANAGTTVADAVSSQPRQVSFRSRK